MRKRPKLLVLDVDRTLLTNDYRLLPEVVEAVSQAQQEGLEVMLATARSPQASSRIASELGVTGPAICFNGAWTGLLRHEEPDTGTSHPLNGDAARELIAEAEAAGLNPCWFTNSGCFALSEGHLVSRETQATCVTIEISPSVPSNAEILKLQCLEPLEVNADLLLDQFTRHFSITRSDAHLIELTALGVSKKAAVAEFARSRSIARWEICAIGDSENDQELIGWVGTGIAMGNATDAVKAAAIKTTKSNQEAGVAHAITWLLESTSAGIKETFA